MAEKTTLTITLNADPVRALLVAELNAEKLRIARFLDGANGAFFEHVDGNIDAVLDYYKNYSSTCILGLEKASG